MVYRTLFLALLLLAQRARAEPGARGDGMFPPKAAAQDAIHWDNGYFVIDGKPTFISSGPFIMPASRANSGATASGASR